MDTDWNYIIHKHSCSLYIGPFLIYQHLALINISLGVKQQILKMSQTLGQLFESLYQAYQSTECMEINIFKLYWTIFVEYGQQMDIYAPDGHIFFAIF